MSQTTPVQTFICYAHEDRAVVESIREHLSVYQKKKLLEIWHDGMILPGEKWGDSIEQALRAAELILLFISVKFINSDYIEKKELQEALIRHQSGDATLIPIIVSSCDWEEYFNMGQFQALPKGAKPILSKAYSYKEDAYHEVALGVKEVAQKLSEKKSLLLQEELSETKRNRADEAFWRKTTEALQATMDPSEKIHLLQIYTEDALHKNFTKEANSLLEDLEAEIAADKKIKSATAARLKAAAAEQRYFVAEAAANLAATADAFKQKTQETARIKAAAEAEQQRLAAEAAARLPRNGDAFRDADDLPEMIYVEGGTFEMGSNEDESEQPIHTVTLPGFYMGKYPITQAEWRNLMPDNPSHFKGDQLPVTDVSWEDVQVFLQKMKNETGHDYRLPSEAEWEYAAKGGNISKGYTYAGSNNLDDVAWYAANSGHETHPVGQKKPNELGLYDMSGNVWEWCADDGCKNYKGASSNGIPWIDRPRGKLRVYRGGGWNDDPMFCRPACRNSWHPDYSDINLGFRLAFVPAVR